MASKPDLQTLFETFLGSRNVYFQPPNNISMNYDAIRYTLDDISTRYADDKKYKNMKRYNVIVISRRPEPAVVDKILELPYSKLGKPYIADNLNHYPITLYY